MLKGYTGTPTEVAMMKRLFPQVELLEALCSAEEEPSRSLLQERSLQADLLGGEEGFVKAGPFAPLPSLVALPLTLQAGLLV